jgi:transcriptional regulator with XRE-family HTH domain
MQHTPLEVGDLKLLQALAKSHRLTHRDLANIAGYHSHSYIGRLLRGEANTLEPTPAARLASHFKIDLTDLFVPKAAGITGKSDRRTRKAAA